MTSAETRYAQIEKELLSIAFSCERFHQFIFGATVLSETDHKPLVNIFKKPLTDCPLRIQKLLLRLQKYDLHVQYVPGKLLITADVLSRSVEKETGKIEETRQDKDIALYVNTVIETMPFSDERMRELRENTRKDPELMILKEVILEGWPASKHNRPFHNCQSNWNRMTTQCHVNQ